MSKKATKTVAEKSLAIALDALTEYADFVVNQELTFLMEVAGKVNKAVTDAHGDAGEPWFMSKDARTLTGTAARCFAHLKMELESRNYSNVSVAWGRVKFYAADAALADNQWVAFRAAVAAKSAEGKAVKAKGVAAQKAKRAKKAAAASAGRTVASTEVQESAAVEREVSEAEVQTLALRKFTAQESALLMFADKFAVAVGGIKDTTDMPADVLRAVDAMVALFDKALAPKVAPLAKRMPAALNKARQELTAAPEAK